MKRTALWVLGLGIASVTLVFALRAQERQVAKAPAAPPSAAAKPAPAAEPPAGTVVHTFADETEMEQFAQIWRQRQAALARSAVLESYLVQERQALEQITQELMKTYKLDVAKAYTLDTDRKVLLEREGPPPGAPDAAGAGPAAAVPAQTTP